MSTLTYIIKNIIITFMTDEIQPEQWTPVAIPAGAQLFVPSGDESYDQFGVASMDKGRMIIGGNAPPNTDRNAEGFRIFFKGAIEKIVARVEVEQLTAEQISRIGQLCAASFYCWAMRDVAEGMSIPVQDGVHILRINESTRIAGASALTGDVLTVQDDIHGIMESIGVLAQRLRAKKIDILTKNIAIHAELTQLGVANFGDPMTKYNVRAQQKNLEQMLQALNT